MKRLVRSKGLCKALYYNTPDFENQPNITEPYSLFYQKIYPFLFHPENEEDLSSYITMSIKGFELVNGGSFRDGLIYINAIVHRELMQTDAGWVRSDYLISKIDQQINGMRGIGLGKLQAEDMDEFRLNNSFYGVYVSYRPYDFN